MADAEPAQRRADAALHARRALGDAGGVIWHYNTGGRGAGGEGVNPAGVAAQLKLAGRRAEGGDLVAFLESLTGEPLTVHPGCGGGGR